MAGKAVVYIDDSESELISVKSALRAAGIEAATGTTIDDISHALPNAGLVLIDYHMPGMRGEEVLAELKRRLQPVRGNDMPLFYLYTSDKTLTGAYREFGFDGQCIMKGNPDALGRQLDAAFRMAKLRKMRPGMS